MAGAIAPNFVEVNALWMINKLLSTVNAFFVTAYVYVYVCVCVCEREILY